MSRNALTGIRHCEVHGGRKVGPKKTDFVCFVIDELVLREVKDDEETQFQLRLRFSLGHFTVQSHP